MLKYLNWKLEWWIHPIQLHKLKEWSNKNGYDDFTPPNNCEGFDSETVAAMKAVPCPIDLVVALGKGIWKRIHKSRKVVTHRTYAANNASVADMAAKMTQQQWKFGRLWYWRWSQIWEVTRYFGLFGSNKKWISIWNSVLCVYKFYTLFWMSKAMVFT